LMPPGVRIEGAQVTEEEVALDDAFEEVPFARLVGVPLSVKRLEHPPGGSPDHKLNVATRLMVDPASGFALSHWQSGGALGPLPPVLAARTDGCPFTGADWSVLDNYLCRTTDDAEACHRHGRCPPQRCTPEAFRRYVAEQMSTALMNKQSPTAFMDVVPDLDLRFPKGARVKARGLAKAELNGIVGEVTGRYEQENGRVGVKFPAPHGLLAVRAERLEPEETYSEWSRKMAAEYGFDAGDAH